jgi:proteasome lid subunit RPN8/RPN11
MAEYDTLMEFRETGGICEEIAQEYPNLLSILLDDTSADEVERGVGVIKFKDGSISVTDVEVGKSGVIAASMTNVNLSNMKVEMNQMAQESSSQELWRAYVHTHPRGDPSLSGADIKWMLERAKGMTMGHGEPSEEPNVALLAVARDDSDDIIISGYSVSDNLPSFDIIDFYIRQAEGYKNTRTVKRFEGKYEGKQTFKGREEAYRKLTQLVEEGNYNKPGALDRCHAVIKGVQEDG